MDIASLLAQGVQTRPAGMQQNALMQAQEFKQRQAQNALMQMQMQAAQEKRAQDQQNALMQQNLINSIPSPQMQASQAALAGGGGPTVANAAQMKPVDQRTQMLHDAMRARMVSPVEYINAAMPAPAKPEYKVVGDALVAIGPQGVKEAYKGQPKPADLPGSVREFQFAQENPAFDEWNRTNKKSAASNFSVNTGQKGLDNTLKLRGDFRSEPVYKAHQEMQSAHAQIKQALGQKSPAGDLAGATKIMKLLDPGSVVRESELGMAMAATGLLDRATNLANSIISGEKLTPSQRIQFQQLADALYSESVNQYNTKRSEYQGIAERNGLSVPDVLGGASVMPAPAGKKSGQVMKFDANGNPVK